MALDNFHALLTHHYKDAKNTMCFRCYCPSVDRIDLLLKGDYRFIVKPVPCCLEIISGLPVNF